MPVHRVTGNVRIEPTARSRDAGVQLNLTGVFHGMKAGAPLILESGGGSIVSTASISGTRPAAGEAPSAAAKAAVVALTASAALEYGPTIRVNAVSPGMIHTGLTDILLSGFDWTVRAARFVNGQNVVVDGGMTLHGSGVDGLFERFQSFLPGS